LRYTWIAAPREIPGLDEPAVSAVIVIDEATVAFNANDNGNLVLASGASAVDTRTLRFALQADGSGCHRGDIGTYLYQLSPTGRGPQRVGTAGTGRRQQAGCDRQVDQDDPWPHRDQADSRGSWRHPGRHARRVRVAFVDPSLFIHRHSRSPAVLTVGSKI